MQRVFIHKYKILFQRETPTRGASLLLGRKAKCYVLNRKFIIQPEADRCQY